MDNECARECPLCYNAYSEQHVPVCLASGVLVCAACCDAIMRNGAQCPFSRMHLDAADSVYPRPCLYAVEHMGLTIPDAQRRVSDAFARSRPRVGRRDAAYVQCPHLRTCALLHNIQRSCPDPVRRAYLSLEALMWGSAGDGLPALHELVLASRNPRDRDALLAAQCRAVTSQYIIFHRSHHARLLCRSPSFDTFYLYVYRGTVHGVVPFRDYVAPGSVAHARPSRSARIAHKTVQVWALAALAYLAYQRQHAAAAPPPGTCGGQSGEGHSFALLQSASRWLLYFATRGWASRRSDRITDNDTWLTLLSGVHERRGAVALWLMTARTCLCLSALGASEMAAARHCFSHEHSSGAHAALASEAAHALMMCACVCFSIDLGTRKTQLRPAFLFTVIALAALLCVETYAGVVAAHALADACTLFVILRHYASFALQLLTMVVAQISYEAATQTERDEVLRSFAQ